jgi:predicted molibdopterin-dependent oxidoreductase YjgC
MSFHFREAAANILTNDALDPVAKIPEFKVCAVRLEKLAEPAMQESTAGRAAGELMARK